MGAGRTVAGRPVGAGMTVGAAGGRGNDGCGRPVDAGRTVAGRPGMAVSICDYPEPASQKNDIPGPGRYNCRAISPLANNRRRSRNCPLL